MSPTFPLLATFLAARLHLGNLSLSGRSRCSHVTHLEVLQSLLEEKTMVLRSRSVWVVMILMALLVPSSVCRADGQGIVVETVVPGSVAEKAGIQVGDRLLTYNGKPLLSPATLRAERENTFDKKEVNLAFQQGQQQRTAMVPVGTLGITVRPVLSAEVLTLYQEGSSAVQADQVAQALSKWTQAVQAAMKAGDKDGAAWLKGLIGNAYRAQNQAKAAREAYESAWMLLKTGDDPAAQNDVLTALGTVCYSLSDLNAAKAYFTLAQETAVKAGCSLWNARCLNDLGIVVSSMGDLKAAQDYYERSLTIFEKLAPGSLDVEGSLNNLGNVAWKRGDLKSSQNYYERSLALSKKLAPGSLIVATSLNNLGLIAWKRGDLKAAQDYHQQAMAIRQKLAPGSLDVAYSLLNLGIVARDRGDLKVAQDYYERSLALSKKLAPGSLIVATSLNNLGLVARDRGDLKAAQDYYERSLAIKEKLAPGSLEVAYSLNGLGNVAADRGDLKAAQDYYERSLAIREKLAPGSLNVAESLNNLGLVAFDREDLKAAQVYLQRALVMREELAPGSLDEADSLLNLGNVASKYGDQKASQGYFERALAIREKWSPGSLAEAQCLTGLGNVAYFRRDLKAAQDYDKRALAIQEALSPGSLEVAGSFNNLGLVAWKRGDLKAAQDYHKRALDIQEKLAPGSLEVAGSLTNLGNALLDQHHPTEALPLFTRAVALVESQRAKVNSSEGRTLFASQHTNEYSGLLECQLALHDYPAAFATLERSRARGLVELLTERHLDFRKDAPADLLQQQDDLSAQKAAAYTHLAKLDPNTDTDQITALHSEIENVNTRQRELDAKIRQASPKLAALQYPQPLDLKAAQSALDPGTLLLAYALQDDKTYLFAVTGLPHPGLQVYTLPIQATELQKQVEAFRAALAHRGNFLTSGQALYRLLIQPAQHQINQAQRLLICPDGPLHTLPFAALVAQDISASTRPGTPAATGHSSLRGGRQRSRGQRGTEIVNGLQRLDSSRLSHLRYLADLKPLSFALSATVFADLKKRRATLPPDRSTLSLLAYGDPIYTSSKDSAERNLSRLPGTRAEVLALGRLYGQQAKIRLGTDASEAALKHESSQAHYLHLACHGLLDQQDALASGLALTPGGGEDGLLQAWEIFEQVKLNADLVVLSACETGLGQTTRTEGVTGLTRALQYAGAQSVFVSLWSVADESTPPLMTTFYQQLRAGKSKDVALQAAMQALRQKPAYRHPYYWAPFTLIGDWR